MSCHRNCTRRRSPLALASDGAGTAAAATYVIFYQVTANASRPGEACPAGQAAHAHDAAREPQSIAIEDFDQEKSDKVNKEGLGNAYLLTIRTGSRSSLPNPEEKKSRPLSEYIRARPQSVDSSRPEPRDGELTEGDSRGAPPSAAAAESPGS